MHPHARTDHLGRDVVVGRKLPGGVLRYTEPPARPLEATALLSKAAQQVSARLFPGVLVLRVEGVRGVLWWVAAPSDEPADMDAPDDVWSLASLPSLESLEKGFAQGKINTLLIAVSPYVRLPIYGDEHMQAYNGLPASRSQSMVISGESGAGKSETAMKVLQYLAFAATNGSAPSGSSDSPEACLCGGRGWEGAGCALVAHCHHHTPARRPHLPHHLSTLPL